jgi:hypothetical protein
VVAWEQQRQYHSSNDSITAATTVTPTASKTALKAKES